VTSGLHAIWAAFRFEARLQVPWMSVNFALAVLPGIGALVLHRWNRHLGFLRWLILVAVALLLPNAPYVVTDLIHLRGGIQGAPNRTDVWAGVLPLFAILICTGVLSYAYTMHLMRKHLRLAGWSRRRRVAAEVAADVLCALGVALGRISRLNSWDVFRPVRLLNGLKAITLDPRSLALALAVVFLAGVVVDRVASDIVHALRDRLRHR
jgi:uncharacterized membrane protein